MLNSNVDVLLVMGALTFAANFLDCYTTYVGVYIKKVAVESDLSAAWMEKTPLRLLTIKPLGILAMCAAFIVPVALLGPAAPDVVVALGGVIEGITAIWGGISAYHNYQINKG